MGSDFTRSWVPVALMTDQELTEIDEQTSGISRAWTITHDLYAIEDERTDATCYF
jgi:hypothetical protein